MKNTKSLTAAIFACTLCMAACTNNNHNTGGMDSSSVSTSPDMQGLKDTISNTGMSASDSTDIRMPMAKDSSQGASTRTGAPDSSSQK
jgi:hypothetical protein